MASRGCKTGELFRRTMLERAASPNRDDTEIQDNNQGKSLATRIEHSPVYVQLIGESLEQNEDSTDRAVLDYDQPRNKSKGERKAANQPDSSSKNWFSNICLFIISMTAL